MPPPAPTWKLTLSYDGTSFHGWQVQPGRATLQGALSDAIAHITGERVLPQGSGRTDAGVHALGQVASFALAAPIPAPNLLRALNRVLPASLRILAAEIAPPGFHARHSALHKTYQYRIFQCRLAEPGPAPAELPADHFMEGLIASVWGEAAEPFLTGSSITAAPFTPRPIAPQPGETAGASFTDGVIVRGWDENVRAETDKPAAITERICPPFLAPFVWDCRWPLQLEPMQRAAAHLLGVHDFTSFAATDPDLAQRATDPAPDTLSPRPELPSSSRIQNLSSRPEVNDLIVDRSGETRSSSRASSSAPNPIKTIFTSTVTRENNILLYRITGSGFLHHMVRNLVGTLIEIGRGRLNPDVVPQILAARNRSAAGPTAPARGLFLVSVAYPSPGPTQGPPPTTEGRP